MKAWLDRNEREPVADVPSESLEDFRVWMRERGGPAGKPQQKGEARPGYAPKARSASTRESGHSSSPSSPL